MSYGKRLSEVEKVLSTFYWKIKCAQTVYVGKPVEGLCALY